MSSYSPWTKVVIRHFAVTPLCSTSKPNYITLLSFYLLSGIYNICTSAKHLPLFIPPTLPLKTHTHTQCIYLIHTHTATQTGVTLPPWGRTMFNCSSALSTVFCRLGIKGEEERERKRSEAEKLAPRRIPNTEGEENTAEERRENRAMCLIVLEADGQTIRQTHSLT